MIAHADPAAILHALDAAFAAFRAAFIAALTPHPAPPNGGVENPVAQLPMPAVAPIVPAQAPKRAKTDKERQDKRRAALAELGLPANTRGSLKELTARHACHDSAVTCHVTPVTPVSTYSLRSEVDDDDEDARARENLVSGRIGPAQAEVAERIASQVTQIIKEAGKWPPNGWNRSVMVEQLRKLLGRGVNENVLLDQVRVSTDRASGRIYSFQFFERDILKAHEKATREPELPLARSVPHERARQPRSGSRERRETRKTMLDVFTELAAECRPTNSSASGTPPHRLLSPQFYARFGSAELDAWQAYRTRTEGKTYATGRDGGRWFESQWPPDHDVRQAS